MSKNSNNASIRLRVCVVLGVLVCAGIVVPAAANEDPVTDALWEMNFAAFGRYGP